MGRRSVWSDAEVVALAKRFVPAADEVWRLQNDGDPECRFFREMVRGDARPSRGTMQGTYLFAGNGKLLGRINTYSADATREVMERALLAFEGLPAAARKLADPAAVAPGFRWEQSYPEDGLVLMRTARDLPGDHDPAAQRSAAFNRDAVWFSKDEARTLLPADLAVGAVGAASRAVALRLAQFVLVDNARGQTLPYHEDEVQDAGIATRISAITGARVHLQIESTNRAVAKGPWLFGDNYWKPDHPSPHSIASRLIGEATFDRKTGRFVAFEAVALGRFRGSTSNNGRGRKPEGSIGFVLQLAPAEWRVAPTFINVYNAGWVKHPK